MTRRPMFEPRREDLPDFLRRPGRPEPRDAVSREGRVKPAMPDLKGERVFRDLGDCLSLIGVGMFLGALLALAIERVWF